MKTKLLLLFLFFVSLSLYSQEDSLRLKFGIYGNFLLNYHSADFKKLPDCPNCSPGFESGDGNGMSFGALFEYPFSKLFYGGVRVGLSDISAKLIKNEPTTVIVNGVASAGSFEHSIEATLKAFSIEPMIKYMPAENIFINAGIDFSILMKKEYSQYEKIIGNGTFIDEYGVDTESKIRNQLSGELKNTSSFLMSPFVGISYELPLNENRVLLLEPEAFYFIGLSNIIDDDLVTKWKAGSLRFGLALKYSPAPAEPIIDKYQKDIQIDTISIVNPNISKNQVVIGKPIITTNVKEKDNIRLTIDSEKRTDTLFLAKDYKLEADVTAIAIGNDDKEIDLKSKIKIEEFVQNKLQPLLNYIFFEENSSQLADRYTKINSSQTKKFNEKQTYELNTLQTYYQILNIVGARLIEYPNAKLTITGCNDDETEKSDKTLSLARANSVKEYFVKIWNIEDKRLNVISRNLPSVPSKPLIDVEKMAENRRVELSTDNYNILKPVKANDTVRVSYPKKLRFIPEINSEAGLKAWNISIMQDNKIIKEFNGKSIAENIDWDICNDRISIPKSEAPLEYLIKTEDLKNGKFNSKIKALNVEQIKISEKRKNNLGDKEIDNFSLILFEFDKSDIKGENKKIMDIVSERIKPNSSIQINGYTDGTGEEEYNKNLSQKRANEVKTLIKRPDAIANGIGEGVLLYDNNLPEGRFYCRIVTITLETPISK